MSRVNVNDKIVNIDKIIAYGCSWTAGDELYDHLIHPKADRIKRKHGISHWKENYDSLEIRQKLNITGQERVSSWAAQTAEMLGVDNFVNKAIGGYSMDSIAFRFEQDVYNGSLTENTLALVGITTPWRVMHFKKESSHIIKNILFSSNLPDHMDARTLLKIYTDDLLYYNFFNAIQRMILIANEKNINLYMVSMAKFLPKYIEEYNKSAESISIVRELVTSKFEELKRSNYINHNNTIYSFVDDPKHDHHGGNHPKYHIHTKLAQAVSAKLLDIDRK